MAFRIAHKNPNAAAVAGSDPSKKSQSRLKNPRGAASLSDSKVAEVAVPKIHVISEAAANPPAGLQPRSVSIRIHPDLLPVQHQRSAECAHSSARSEKEVVSQFFASHNQDLSFGKTAQALNAADVAVIRKMADSYSSVGLMSMEQLFGLEFNRIFMKLIPRVPRDKTAQYLSKVRQMQHAYIEGLLAEKRRSAQLFPDLSGWNEAADAVFDFSVPFKEACESLCAWVDEALNLESEAPGLKKELEGIKSVYWKMVSSEPLANDLINMIFLRDLKGFDGMNQKKNPFELENMLDAVHGCMAVLKSFIGSSEKPTEFTKECFPTNQSDEFSMNNLLFWELQSKLSRVKQLLRSFQEAQKASLLQPESSELKNLLDEALAAFSVKAEECLAEVYPAFEEIFRRMCNEDYYFGDETLPNEKKRKQGAYLLLILEMATHMISCLESGLQLQRPEQATSVAVVERFAQIAKKLLHQPAPKQPRWVEMEDGLVVWGITQDLPKDVKTLRFSFEHPLLSHGSEDRANLEKLMAVCKSKLSLGVRFFFHAPEYCNRLETDIDELFKDLIAVKTAYQKLPAHLISWLLDWMDLHNNLKILVGRDLQLAAAPLSQMWLELIESNSAKSEGGKPSVPTRQGQDVQGQIDSASVPMSPFSSSRLPDISATTDDAPRLREATIDRLCSQRQDPERKEREGSVQNQHGSSGPALDRRRELSSSGSAASLAAFTQASSDRLSVAVLPDQSHKDPSARTTTDSLALNSGKRRHAKQGNRADRKDRTVTPSSTNMPAPQTMREDDSSFDEEAKETAELKELRTYKDLSNYLRRKGFEVESGKGSHQKFVNKRGSMVVLPHRPGNVRYPLGTQKSIYKQIQNSAVPKTKKKP